MDMIPVISSAIKAIGYDSHQRWMKIQFAQGDTYDFCNVPEYIFNGLLNARSKGGYYNDHIRDKYDC
jgi:hypothetical protein